MIKRKHSLGAILEKCLPCSDEASAYYALYGDLYFYVPHYVKNFKFSSGEATVTFASGSSISITEPRYNHRGKI